MKFFLLALASAALVPLQEPKDGKPPETVRFRTLPEIVDQIAKEVESNDRATVLWLLDNSAVLKTARQGELLAESIRKSFKKPRISHTVVLFGRRPEIVQTVTEEPARAASAVQTIADGAPDNSIKDCLAAVREAAKTLSGFAGRKRYLVLFTQENGDNEDDVEETLALLKASGIVFLPVVPEAVYSDPYWESALAGTTYVQNIDRIRKLKLPLKGPESAFVEFPYGWPFSWVEPAYTVPSGFAPYAIDRLATCSGGRSFLHSADSSPQSFCRRYGCRACGGLHQACGGAFDETRLRIAAPDVGSRAEHLARCGRDPIARAIAAAWERLYRDGVLRGIPPLKAGGSGLVENERPNKRPPTGYGTPDWKAARQDAAKGEQSAEKAISDLSEAAKKAGKETPARTRATLDALLVHLRILVQSYRQLALFSDEMERVTRGARAGSDGVGGSALEPPGADRPLGFTWQNYYLCHGGAALKEVKFLGDAKGLHAALDFADEMIEKHRGTPWEILIRRASVPVFVPYYELGRAAPADRPRPKSDGSSATTETAGNPSRPARPTQGDPAQGSGTATGNR